MDESKLAIEIGNDEVADGGDQPTELDHTKPEIGMNPLDSTSGPYIVPTVLGNFSELALHQLRLVSTLWAKEANTEIERTKTVSLVHNDGITNYLEYFPGSSAVEETRVKRLVHQKYELYQIQFNNHNLPLHRFLEIHGGHVKMLSLQQKHGVNESFLHMVLGTHLPKLKWLCLRFPPFAASGASCSMQALVQFQRIKTLTLGAGCFRAETITIRPVPEQVDQAPPNVHRQEFGRVQAIMRFTPNPALVRLFTCLESLKKLIICTRDTACTTETSAGIIETLVAVPPGNLSRLAQLEFPLCFTETLLQNFNNRNLAGLTIVDVQFDSSCNAVLVHQLFLMIARTIIKLKVSFARDYPTSQVARIPDVYMANLKVLKLNGYRWPMNFLRYQHNLESIHVIRSRFSAFPTCMGPMNNMRSLRIEGQSYGLNEEILAAITFAYPKLHVLEFPRATNECLRLIYRDLPLLTNLILKNGTFTDSGVCGLSDAICDDYVETFSYKDLKADPDRLRSYFFIGNLQRLQRVVLESDRLRVMSIFSGVVKCVQLQHVKLKSIQLGNESVQILVHGLHRTLKTLNMTSCPLVTAESKILAKASIPTLDIYVPGDEHPEDPDIIAFKQSRSRHSRFSNTTTRQLHEAAEDVPGFAQGNQGMAVDLDEHVFALDMINWQVLDDQDLPVEPQADGY